MAMCPCSSTRSGEPERSSSGFDQTTVGAVEAGPVPGPVSGAEAEAEEEAEEGAAEPSVEEKFVIAP
ncbi:hypothetical protein GCM10009784_30410 [Arthrobacter parietis]|uniref:Uncharacterized protein n=1 Tax=Arthrobacter parietis TaxID=271434 RepID=A0ABP5MRS2_9MICC